MEQSRWGFSLVGKQQFLFASEKWLPGSTNVVGIFAAWRRGECKYQKCSFPKPQFCIRDITATAHAATTTEAAPESCAAAKSGAFLTESRSGTTDSTESFAASAAGILNNRAKRARASAPALFVISSFSNRSSTLIRKTRSQPYQNTQNPRNQNCFG